MIGFRAFGHNEGSLGHAGDFGMLFAPLLSDLSTMAVYGLEPPEGLTFPFYWKCDDLDEAERRIEALLAALDALDICPRPKADDGVQWPRYYGAGFFPRFAPYIGDDWNNLVCFRAPFPDYELLLRAAYGDDPMDYNALQARTAVVQRIAWLETGFDFYFRNIDACWWEVFSPHRDAMQQLAAHFTNSGIANQELSFEHDFPESATPVNREFRDVHVIWTPKGGQQ